MDHVMGPPPPNASCDRTDILFPQRTFSQGPDASDCRKFSCNPSWPVRYLLRKSPVTCSPMVPHFITSRPHCVRWMIGHDPLDEGVVKGHGMVPTVAYCSPGCFGGGRKLDPFRYLPDAGTRPRSTAAGPRTRSHRALARKSRIDHPDQEKSKKARYRCRAFLPWPISSGRCPCSYHRSRHATRLCSSWSLVNANRSWRSSCSCRHGHCWSCRCLCCPCPSWVPLSFRNFLIRDRRKTDHGPCVVTLNASMMIVGSNTFFPHRSLSTLHNAAYPPLKIPCVPTTALACQEG